MKRISACLCLWACLALPSQGAARDGAPADALQVGVEEHPGGSIPLELRFVDAEGQSRRLKDYVRGELPVVLVLAYTKCRTLCNVVLRSVTGAIAQLTELEPGRDFRALAISIDPRETAAAAHEKQARLAQAIGHPDEPWRFPVWRGRETAIESLADALGFQYAWDPRTEQYAHPAVAFVLRPGGTIAAYLHGVMEGPEPLREALVTARAGEVQAESSLVGTVLRCFRLDPTSRRYGSQIQAYFRVGGVLLFLAVAGLLLRLSVRRRRGQHG